MQKILNNPYRILGLLIGTSAAQKNRHISRISRYIDAGDEIPKEFTENSFKTLGELNLTLNTVNEAVSKLNLDSDKMNAALFWFWIGNPITDEPALDALREGDLDTVMNIWEKLTLNGEVTQRNASAYSNLGTFYLSGILEGTNTNEALLEKGLFLKLKFLESDFAKDFKASATDETFRTTKKELQLLLLNEVQNDIEKSSHVTVNQFLEIIIKLDFLAKEGFLKGFIQKPIEQIEKKIEDAKEKRKADKANAEKVGQDLFTKTTGILTQIKSIAGASDLKYTSIADKIANEILQCSIDYFNDNREKKSTSNFTETALKLAKQAETIAVGNLTKDRIKDNINTLEEMKDREILQAIAVLQSIKEAYEEACKQIDKQVDSLMYNTFQGIGGNKPIKIPKLNVSIDWSKVDEMKRNSLAWDKVIELVGEAIPQENIDKIKNVTNTARLNDYKTLVNFLMSKLSKIHKKKIGYIAYWDTPKITSSSSDEGIPDWIKLLGVIIIVIILIKACN